jgi:hypothetical protein
LRVFAEVKKFPLEIIYIRIISIVYARERASILPTERFILDMERASEKTIPMIFTSNLMENLK